jgi:hypothetical protein
MNLVDRNAVATTTYRRANGSQAAASKPRVVRAPKTFPRAHTPSPDARLLERYIRACGPITSEAGLRADVREIYRRDAADGLNVLPLLLRSAREHFVR